MNLALLLLARFSLAPELFDYFRFDAKAFLEFVDRFGGMTITIPSREEVGRLARNCHIYREVSARPLYRPIKERLALTYGLDVERIESIFNETREVLEELDHGSGIDSEEVIDLLRGDPTVV